MKNFWINVILLIVSTVFVYYNGVITFVPLLLIALLLLSKTIRTYIKDNTKQSILFIAIWFLIGLSGLGLLVNVQVNEWSYKLAFNVYLTPSNLQYAFPQYFSSSPIILKNDENLSVWVAKQVAEIAINNRNSNNLTWFINSFAIESLSSQELQSFYTQSIQNRTTIWVFNDPIYLWYIQQIVPNANMEFLNLYYKLEDNQLLELILTKQGIDSYKLQRYNILAPEYLNRVQIENN